MKLHPAIEPMGQSKNQMIVVDRQDVALLAFAPAPAGSTLALRTVSVSTAMVLGNLAMAVITLIPDTTQNRRMAAQQMPTDLQSMAIECVTLNPVVKIVLQ
jgi:hypothetical protein